MAIKKAEGIVLKNHKIRETSQITTLYTREFGKIDCLVKGLRSDKSKYGSRLGLFSHNRIVFYEKEKSGLHLISQCDLLDDFNLIGSDIVRLAYASYFLELINEFAKPQDKDERLFLLLCSSLQFLNSAETCPGTALSKNKNISQYNSSAVKTKPLLLLPELKKLSFVFEVKLLKAAGLMPRLEYCVACQDQSAKAVSFSSALGGVLCHKCRAKEPQARPIFKGVTSTLIHLEKEEFERLISDRFRIILSVANQLRIILREFIQFHLEKDLKSSRFLERVIYQGKSALITGG